MEASRKKKLVLAGKIVVSVTILALIGFKVLHRENIDGLWARVANLSVGWLVVALCIQLGAVACSIVRWGVLLRGQGIYAPWSHLVSAFMTGRFFSTVSPGGWTGLDAYRIYDIASRTKKTARATATVGVDKLLGQAALGGVIVAGSVYGAPYLGTTKVLIIDGAFLGLIATIFLLLTRPRLFQLVATRLPSKLRLRVQTTVDAVSAYHGRGKLLGLAFLLSVGTHALTNLIAVGAAHALGLDLGVGGVFFVSTMQVLATLVPISINGVGLREAVAVRLFGEVGVSAGEAVLIPILYFAIDMLVSTAGGLFLVIPRREPVIRVENPEREDAVHAQLPDAPREAWPKVGRGLQVGLGAGLLAGVLLGMGEAVVILASAGGASERSVLLYGAGTYGVAIAVAGAALGAGLAFAGRVTRRAAVPEPVAFARLTAVLLAAPALAIGAFRVRRDMYAEMLVWKSLHGLGVLLVCLAAAAVLYLVVSTSLRLFTTRRFGAWLARPWGAGGVSVAVVGALAVLSASTGAAGIKPERRRAAAPTEATNVLVVVVDTLRADHLPAYGYRAGRTPSLDAFARDAIRFEHAFANASWTRPSFATILTGRLPSSHQTMQKSESLPDEIVTMPEQLASAGFATEGIVTNYNVGPFFNFDQGFDEYRYLEPDFVLGANDTAAKLLFIQFARQQLEQLEGARPGRAYRDAETVNREIFGFLGRAPRAPWFLFVGYMDPHDPYFAHPYDGEGYSRAGHQSPEPSLAPRLRRLYDGEITYWDASFGALVRDLRRRGLYDDMTIIVTSDHGEEFMEHGGFWHGTTLYDEQVRVPLFVKLPQNEQAGTVVSHWVQLADLAPTVLQLVGVPLPAGVQGHSLFEGRDEVFAEESHEGNVLSSVRIRQGEAELKLIRANEDNPRGLEPTELYRVDRDPGELTNLARREAEVLRVAEAARVRNQGLARVRAAHGQDVDVDAAAAARLRALGYAGADGEHPPAERPSPPQARTEHDSATDSPPN